MPDTAIVSEKTAQAAAALDALDIDCWLVFCRETGDHPEPTLPFVLDVDVVWPTAVLVTRAGRAAVVIGRYDAPNARLLDDHEVYPYDASLREDLLGLLDEIDPASIAINYSRDDPSADGLSHGMYLQLCDLLDGTPYADRLVSAAPVVDRVRGEKSPTELARMERAAERTVALLDALVDAWVPDWTERTARDWLHARCDEAGLGTAWAREYCPTVHFGDVEVGHTLPSDERTLPRGELLHVDFGVVEDGYAADLQRVWFRDDGDGVPDGLQRAFDDVRAAIDAGVDALEIGAVGHEVDAAARETVTDRGWPAYQHALGHQVGRTAHDGGTLLAPRWERYGQSPEGRVREGEVYTVELGVETAWGYVGQEELVVVAADGPRYLVDPQTEIPVIDR